MSSARASSPPPWDLLRPSLDDVSDGTNVAIFDPERISDRHEWIQIDKKHVVPAEDAR